MNQQTTGTVLSAVKPWWRHLFRKRTGTAIGYGAPCPYRIQVQYYVAQKAYCRWQWVKSGGFAPEAGDLVQVCYCREQPQKAWVLI